MSKRISLNSWFSCDCDQEKRQRNRPQRIAQLLFAAGLIASTVVNTSCTLRPKQQDTTSPSTSSTTAKSALATPVDPPNPGPYKTIEIKGVEYKLGRFPQGKYGGRLIQPQIASDPKTFNPWVAADSVSGQLSGLMFSGLLAMDAYTGDMVPDLAADFKVLPDHLTYIVRLRKGLKWSDGQPITADDVEYTFNTVIGKGYGNTSTRDVMSVNGKMPTVTVVDPLTIKFVTPAPFVPFSRALSASIAPKHILAPILSKKDGRQKFDQLWSQSDSSTAKTLVTSGPFTMSDYVPAQRVEFSRTNNYYVLDPSTKQRLPYLDKLVYLFVPDVTTNLLKFKAKETDVSTLRNRNAVELEAQETPLNFKLYNLGPSSSTTFVMFNENQRKNSKGTPYVTPYKAAWFNDVNFRQAVNHALNRQQMVDGYLLGIGMPAWDSEPAISPFLDTNLKPITQDIDYSKSLLKKSGFTLAKDGMLHDRKGNLVEFDLLGVAGLPFYESIGGYIINDLKKLGMKVNFQPLEGNVLGNKIDSSKDWDSTIYGLAGDPYDPNSGTNVWRSDGRLHLWDEREALPNGTIVVHDARPWEKELDSLFSQGVQEFDPAKRKAIYDRYQQIIYDEAPLIYLINPMSIVGARNTVQNFQPTKLSQGINGLHNIDEIWMDQAK